MITAVIVDDEQNAREDLLHMLQKYCPEVNVISQADNINTGAEAIRRLKPEVVFLDVRMPFGSGFDLLSQFTKIPFEIIFVTAYDEYAIKAIRFSALDYLLKPVRGEELKAAIDRLKIKNNESGEQLKFFAEHTWGNKPFNEIVLPGKHGLDVVDLADIVRCEASGNYTSFNLTNGKKILVAKTLKEFDELLSFQKFMRIHKSHLVNLEHVKSYNRKNETVTMTDGSEVELARRKKDEFLKGFNAF